MKYIAIIDADEKPVSCEFIGCNGNVTPYRIGTTTNIKALEQEPCEDCISREAVLALKTPVDTMTGWSGYMIDALDVEQLPSIQPKPIECEDYISRQAVLDLCDTQDRYEIPYEYDNGGKHIKGYDEGRIINVTKLKVLPPVTPKPKTDVLDKIKVEIEEQVLESLSDGGDDWFVAEKVNECLEIIDKYKAESEDK